MVKARRRYFLLIILTLGSISAFTQPRLSVERDNYFPGIFSVSLQEVVPSNDSNQEDLLVYVFLSPECPLCQHYMPELKKLQSVYKNKIRIKGIIPGRAYSRDTLIYFKNEYAINFSLFIDSVKELSGYLSASVTPEVMLFTKKGERIYQGAIDNWMKELGQKRIKPTEHYLEDAITAALNGRKITVNKTEAKGCLINDF